MCGIIGYCGTAPACERVVDGLLELEYRGYDSAGIAALTDSGLEVRKDTGRIQDVDARYSLKDIESRVAVGHTRWATHGSVTSENTHPHTDSTGRIAVVHNGIIENYQDLRTDLMKEGVVFISETDTEVLPHLISREMKKGTKRLEHAVARVCPKLGGSYAFAAITADEPGKIVCARLDNPLNIGFGKDGHYIGSDALAFADRADRMVALQNGQIAVVTPRSVRLLDMDMNRLTAKRTPVNRTWADTRKNGCRHYMLKEITEQPDALLHTLEEQDDGVLTEIALDILRAERVVFTACGSSRHAALIGRLLFANVARKMSEVVMASEFHHFEKAVDRHTLAIAVSQSGETADVMDGVRKSQSAGANIVAMVNRPSCVLADEAHSVLRLNCGAEIGVAATKSFLCQVGLFYLLANAMCNRLTKARDDLAAAAEALRELVKTADLEAQREMHRLVHKRDFYYIGRGPNFPLAMEGALKMKEISYIHAEGMPAGEMKHGTLALISEGTPIVAVCPNDETYGATLGNAIEAKARGGYIIGVSDIQSDVYDTWLRIPNVAAERYPLMAVVPLQYMAYHMAVLRGCDPDKPRNLAKSVTVR